MNKLTTEVVRALVQKHIDEDQARIDSHNAVYEFLKTIDGKPLNNVTFGKKARAAGFSLNHSVARMVEVINHNSGFKHLVYNSYSLPHVVDADFFHDLKNNGVDYKLDAANYSGAIARIEKMKALDIERLTEILTDLENHWRGLMVCFQALDNEKFCSFYNQAFYDLLRVIYERPNHYNNEFELNQLTSVAKGFKL